MDKPTLLKRLERAIDEAARTRMYGSIEIEFRDGEPAIVRTMKTEKFATTENNRDCSYNR